MALLQKVQHFKAWPRTLAFIFLMLAAVVVGFFGFLFLPGVFFLYVMCFEVYGAQELIDRGSLRDSVYRTWIVLLSLTIIVTVRYAFVTGAVEALSRGWLVAFVNSLFWSPFYTPFTAGFGTDGLMESLFLFPLPFLVAAFYYVYLRPKIVSSSTVHEIRSSGLSHKIAWGLFALTLGFCLWVFARLISMDWSHFGEL